MTHVSHVPRITWMLNSSKFFMKKICVIGLGNPLRKDDGIGIVLLKKLIQNKKTLPKQLEFIDGGTGGMNLLHILPQYDTVIIIDAVQLNAAPGSYSFFSADEIKVDKKKDLFSTHADQLPQVIQLSRQLKELPKQLYIFGVQPKDTTYGTDLSQVIQKNIDTLFIRLKNEIKMIIKKDS